MIIADKVEISLRDMGILQTDHKWEHNRVADREYEIIYVIEGHVSVEDNVSFTLEKGNMLILSPTEKKRHYNCVPNSSFYWVNVSVSDIDKLTGGAYFFPSVNDGFLFKEMLHYYHFHKDSKTPAELILGRIFACNKITDSKIEKRKLAADIYEMIRINASPKLRITDVAEHYGYNKEHISRLIKKEYGVGMKELINKFIILNSKNMLANTNLSVKEIGALMKFDDATAFVKFYKYHEKMTPTEYRNKFSAWRKG